MPQYLIIDTSQVQESFTRAMNQYPGIQRALLEKLCPELLENEFAVTPEDSEYDHARDKRGRIRLNESEYARVLEDGSGIVTGSEGCEHAAAVHEGVHPPRRVSSGDVINYTKPGTGMKFIENPVNEMATGPFIEEAALAMVAPFSV